jgi:hypothetical protein
VWGRELFIDSAKVEVNAVLDTVQPRFAVEVQLAQLFSDGSEGEPAGPPVPPATEPAPAPGTTPLPVALLEADQPALAERAAARHDWIGCAAITRRRLTPGQCTTTRYGWNRSSPKRKTGTD